MSEQYECPYCGQVKVGIEAHVWAKHPEQAPEFKKPSPLPTEKKKKKKKKPSPLPVEEKVQCPFCLRAQAPTSLERHIRQEHEDAAWVLYQKNGHLWPKGQKIHTPREIREAEIAKAMAERGPLAAIHLMVEPFLDEDASIPVRTPEEVKRGNAEFTSAYWQRLRARKDAEEAARPQAICTYETPLAPKPIPEPPDDDDLSFLDRL